MEKAIRVLNELKKKRLVKEYAIGGGMALLFYTEPILTYDLDVFVLLPESEKSLITLSPIYAYLEKKGYRVEGEHIVVEEFPVQFLPAYNELVKEAVKKALEIRYKRAKTRVLRVEHLAAIMLQTYRPKDREHLLLLLEEAQIDEGYFQEVLRRHGLKERWEDFRRRYRNE